MTRVLVTGDCQAAHLSRALAVVAPQFDISTLATAVLDPMDLDTLPMALQSVDL